MKGGQINKMKRIIIKAVVIYAVVFAVFFFLLGVVLGTNFSIIIGAIIGGIFGAIIGYSMSFIASNKKAREMMRMDKDSLNEYGILTALISAAIFWQIARYIVGENLIIKTMALIAGWYVGYKFALAVRRMIKEQ